METADFVRQNYLKFLYIFVVLYVKLWYNNEVFGENTLICGKADQTNKGRCMWIFGLFKKQRNTASSEQNGSKKKAVCFVDYEHWYISLDKHFHLKPNIRAWVDELNQNYNVLELGFFGDFSSPGMQNEMHKIRGFTNKIVETKSGSTHYKKDFSDFIILDHIYQSAMSNKDAQVFIIFTGDGHFSSVALFLKNVCKLDVGIYGIKSGFSSQLKQAASWWRELPTVEDEILPYCQMILSNLYTLEEGQNKRNLPSFWKTIEAVVKKYETEEELIKTALEYLLEKEYITQETRQVSFKKIKVLVPDWLKIENDGLYKRGYSVRMPSVAMQNKNNKSGS